MSTTTVRLWQLISPTLPVGAFGYSQALEHVIESQWVRDEDGVRRWLLELLDAGVGRLDLPILLRAHRAWVRGDALGVLRASRTLEAMRETAELRFEDLAMGGALTQLLTNLELPVPERRLTFACAFAVACASWQIAEHDACMGYAWAWCEAQVAAAIKLVPLGHTAGQRVLLALGAELGDVATRAAGVADDDIGASLPGLAIASALHETQYSRLFRS